MTLIYIALLFSVPVFYVIGLFEVIKSMTRRPTPPAAPVKPEPDFALAAELRDIATEAPPELAARLRSLAAEIASPNITSVDRSHLIMPGDTEEVASTVTPPLAPASARGLNRDLGDVMHSLDNINVILYLGAFLIVVSAGIFVGYNFELLTGVFKTVLLGLFAAAFYGVGLLLFLNARKLRPAGVTFTGTGLVLLPLVGLAAYNFTSLHNHGSATWFATSIITLAAYIATMIITRQTYIAYLMSFTTLSLFESSISLFNLSVYWFGWGMAAVAIVLLALGRWTIFWEDADSAIHISANIFLPLSLTFSLGVIGSEGLSQLGVTLALAGLFYSGMARRYFGRPVSSGYWAMALISLPTALAVGLWDSQPRSVIAAVMLAICGIYLTTEYVFGTKLPQRWRELQALLTGILPLAGIIVMYDDANVILAILIAAVGINAVLALRLRQTSLALLAIISLLAAPYVYSFGVLQAGDMSGLAAALLLALVPALVWWSRRLVGWPESGRTVGQSGYTMALVLALVTAFFSSPTVVLEVGLAAAAAWYIISLTEREAILIYAAAATLYLSMFQPGFIYTWDSIYTVLLLLATGGVLYAIGAVEPDVERSTALRYSGLIGPFLGALAGLFTSSGRIEPALSLAAGGGLLWIESKRLSESSIRELAIAIWVLSLNWACAVWGVTQVQAYTLPWAAYVALLAYRHRHEGMEVYNGFIAVALAILTIPLAGQALADDGQLYGLFLIIEAIMLVFLGIALSNKLIRSWGIATLVIEVLYQMKDVFLALPKYLISAGLGLALLVIAIVLLQRRKL